MATVIFTQNLRRHVNAERCEVGGSTVAAAMEEVFTHYPRARGYLLDDSGAVRRHVVLLVNGQSILDRKTLTDPLPHDAELFVVQALSGG
jgi:sulfur carrier protein ThiS